MCVPSKPWYFGQQSPNQPLRNVSRPRIGVQGESGLQASLYYIPCAVCLARLRSISVMIPARKECSRGWHREYDGFLAVQVLLKMIRSSVKTFRVWLVGCMVPYVDLIVGYWLVWVVRWIFECICRLLRLVGGLIDWSVA